VAEQDFYDPLEPFDYIVQKLKDAQPTLGLEYVAENDEDLLPAYPAVLVQSGRTERLQHATGLFLVTFNIVLWVFHADIGVGAAVRSRKDIQLATDIRKLLHADRTLGGHIIFGFVEDEFPGPTGRVTGNVTTNIVTTRLSWSGNNRVPYEAS
jgi:hypothetical protein